MKKLICQINIGIKQQKVFIHDDIDTDTVEEYTVSLKDLPNFIVNYSDISNVFLKGSKDYLKKIEDETHNLEIQKYNEKKITFTYL